MNEIEDAYAGSRLKAGLERISVALQDSWITGRAGKAYASVDRATPTSRTNRTARKIRAVAGSSWIHDWLTEEPQPGVVEIDLQSSLSVAPFLRLLEKLGSLLGPARKSSYLYGAARHLFQGVSSSLPHSAVVAYLAAILQPPENEVVGREP